MISDEVLTGFRSARSGWWGIEADTDTPYLADITTFGKVIGGGLPLAALGGRRELMELLAPLGPVYQAGTLSGNPVAVAAGIATLENATEAVYERIVHAADTISTAASAALAAEGVAHSVQRAGTLFSIAFAETPPTNYDEVRAQQAFRYPPFFHAMLAAGVSLPAAAKAAAAAAPSITAQGCRVQKNSVSSIHLSGEHTRGSTSTNRPRARSTAGSQHVCATDLVTPAISGWPPQRTPRLLHTVDQCARRVVALCLLGRTAIDPRPSVVACDPLRSNSPPTTGLSPRSNVVDGSAVAGLRVRERSPRPWPNPSRTHRVRIDHLSPCRTDSEPRHHHHHLPGFRLG